MAETPGSRGLYGFDARVAHPARVYDYWLGGKDNFEADRIAGEETIAAYPAIRASARANRAFLARTVSYLSHKHHRGENQLNAIALAGHGCGTRTNRGLVPTGTGVTEAQSGAICALA